MKKFMVVVEYNEEGYAEFFDDYNQALVYAIDNECGLGAYWQIYRWNNHSACYELLQS